MTLPLDAKTAGLLGAVVGVLFIATLIGQILKRRTDTNLNPEVVRHFHLRIRAWWFMCAILAATFLIGREATVVLFGFLSFWALREFITLTPTRPGDHRPLFWVFFIFTPLQYVLIGMEIYGVYSILIPVYAYLFIPARTAWAGDFKRFLERTAKIQFGLMICVYCLSYAPALLSLDLTPSLAADEKQNANARLLFYFVLIAQLGDVLQYVSEKLLGQHLIAPAISGKTWEGFFGSLTMATLLGAALWWATPFQPWEAAGMSMVIAVMGFAGSITMSAIKRDRGVKDYGTLVTGHGGVLDRIDSICFAAPVFFHFAKYFFET